MTNELKPNYVKFAREICQFAFEGCDADGFTIQEIGVKCGVLKVEGFDEEKHPNIVNAEDFEAGDDVYLFVEPIAVPDVAELVRLHIGENGLQVYKHGEYVLYSQAAEIIAVKDAEITEALKQRNMTIDDVARLLKDLASMTERAEAAEAKLSQYEAQKPVAYTLIFRKSYGVNTETTFKKFEDAEKYAIRCELPLSSIIPLYTSPAPSADLQAKLDTANALLTCMCGNDMDKHGTGDGHSPVDQYHYAMMQLEKANERYRKALEFYADTSKYPAPLTGGMGALWSDCGQTAKDALENKP